MARAGVLRTVLAVAGAMALLAVTWWRIEMVRRLPDQGFFTKYPAFAERVLRGDLPRERLADVSPGYLVLVAALRAAGAGWRDVQALQIIAVTLAALAVGAAAARIGGMPAALFGVVFILGSRAALVCATDFEPETLILLLNSLGLAAFVWGRHGLAGLLLGLSAITRPVALLLLAGLFLVLWFRRREHGLRFAAAAAVPILAVLSLNFALTRQVTIMDPGSVFYEAWNPMATGYSFVPPRIITDLEKTSAEPDYLHVAYRRVAEAAEGRPLTRAEANDYWFDKGVAGVTHDPGEALLRMGRKVQFVLHSHDAWDLSTMARKHFQLGRYWIGFGVLASLAAAAVFLCRGAVLALAIAALCGALPMILFVASARQRNALLPAVAILAAIGLAQWLYLALASPRRGAGIAAAVILAAAVLSLPGRWQREDTYNWLATFGWDRSGYAVEQAFDEAVRLQRAGRWAASEAILAGIEEYRPVRENRAVSSVAFYRARAALRLGREAAPLIEQAAREAPADPAVLALRAAGGNSAAARDLDALYDPLTRDLALAVAHADLGRAEKAGALLRVIRSRMPEWRATIR